MLSQGAFNALLKTLEEPPAHVIFILATTEIHKVPQTIISRCQRFDFARLPIPSIVEKLSLIAKKEKIKIESEALEMIALSAEGGMRDAETLLSQVIALEDKNITAKEVEEILGTTQDQTVSEIVKNILDKKPTIAIIQINNLLEEGYDLAVFTKALINYLRQLMLLKIDPELKKYFVSEATKEKIEILQSIVQTTDLKSISYTLELFLEVQSKISAFMIPQLPLEIAIIKATGKIPTEIKKNSSSQNLEIETVNISKTETTSSSKQISSISKNKRKVFSNLAEKKKLINATKKNDVNVDISFQKIKDNWEKLLVDIKPYNHSLGVLLTNCQPIETQGSEIILATPYEFYKEKLEIPAHKLTVEEVFGKILGLKINLKIRIDRSILPKKATTNENEKDTNQENAKENGNLLDSALEIFGGKIVE
jgi:DNA polymerase-3 subunit gamma/tau